MEHRLHIRKKTPILSLGRACTELSVLLRFVFAELFGNYILRPLIPIY